MKIIKNKWLPPKGFSAINLFGVVFTRKDELSECTIRHEAIHTAQIREMLFIFFYVWYGIEFIIRFFAILLVNLKAKNATEFIPFDKACSQAYKNVSFEREAYANDDNISYLNDRKRFSFIKFI